MTQQMLMIPIQSGQDDDSSASLPEIDPTSSDSSACGPPDEPEAGEQNGPEVDPAGGPGETSGAFQADDGEIDTSDHSQVLDALLTAGEGDIDQDVFETIKSALALAPG